MKINKITIKDLLEFLGDDVIRTEGELSPEMYIDNLADMEHVNETTLDWVKPSNPDKQTSPKRDFLKGSGGWI